jgi:small-conductance mechanosensitive channel
MKHLNLFGLANQFLFSLLVLMSLTFNAAAVQSSVEQANIETLNPEVAAAPVVDGVGRHIQSQIALFFEKLEALQIGLQSLPLQIEITADEFSEINGFWLIFLLMFLVAWGVEKVATLKLHRLTQNIELQNELHWYEKLGYMLLGSVFRLISLLVFAVAAIAVAISVYGPSDMGRLLLVSSLSIVVTLRVVSILAIAILAPKASGIRPLPMSSGQAQRLYHWVMAFCSVYAVTIHGTALLLNLDFHTEVVRLVLVSMGFILALLVFATILIERRTINTMFIDDGDTNALPIRQTIQKSWPILASIWFIMLWAMWAFNTFIGNTIQSQRIDLVWWLTLAFPLLDRLVFSLLNRIVSLPVLQVGGFPKRATNIVSTVLIGFRLILVGAVIVALSEAWGLGSFAALQSTGGQAALGNMIDIIIIGLIAYMMWEAVRIMIEKHLPEEAGDANSLDEDDVGGSSRTETLLPLLRSFVKSVLVIIVTLMVLSNLGIEIGPLLAGAGVIGIAIGFGAQKLVQDVISGIFFLLDDAFRRGEYIVTGTLKGTVEKISMRSMQLRHHLGALQTVPYGEIGTVKNLSRDWVTMKLEMRFPYNADIEKIRKIIKKIGQSLLEDEELGPQFILPLKSQGVIRTEESALIVRMKFTTHPGKQWVVRRVAFQRVRDALSDAGIEFAHREVRVRLPEEYEKHMGGDKPKALSTDLTKAIPAAKGDAIERAMAAAATAAVLANDKIDGLGDDGDDR